MRSAFDWLRRTEGYQKTLAGLREGGGSFRLAGLWGSSRALLLAALREDLARPLAAVAPGVEEAESLAFDIESLAPGAPPPRVWPLGETDDPLSGASDRETFERLSILAELAGNAPPFLLVPAPALLDAVRSIDPAAGRGLVLAVGEAIPPESVVARLAAAGLERAPRVETPLQYARRGGIVDCFLPVAPGAPGSGSGTAPENPVRIEWDGDRILSLRFFDPLTQESVGTMTRLALLLPAPKEEGSGSLVPLTERLAKETLIAFLDRPEIERRLANLAADPSRIPDFRPDRIAGDLASRATVDLSESPVADGDRIPFSVRSLARFTGDLAARMETLKRIAREKRELVVFVRTGAERTRFDTLSSDHGIDWKGRVSFAPGSLARGFDLAPDGPILAPFPEIFHGGEARRTSARIPAGVRRAVRAVEELAELRPGDIVVHEREGIAVYRGLARLSKEGADAEHLKLEFAEKTVLYVPVDEIHLVSRYIGAGTEKPALSRLGGRVWKNTRAAAAAATREFAAELLRIQALRQAHPATPVVPESAFADAFDAAFPYPPTRDQEEASAAIARDMARSVPMDRLLCGDVGFGKTEIAMRASFRAVACGRQVAVLVPTTILALQHAKSFAERFAAFPVRIAAVSRLVPAAGQKKILAAARKGEIDILIGTHRLLSKDVAFADLGLLVVDEEQKFGVAAKTRLKSMRAALHVLSLSATPIPRTLHESLLGIKEISNLSTPPLDRRAIVTRVARFSEPLVQKAVADEIAREGQVFLVHNRIAGLDRMKRLLARLVPRARVAVGHGKLSAERLERVMLDLAERRVDVLLSTTIVESGLDFPNVNTLIVTDAQRYGLAELHQLRGRVGRFKRQAYAHLLVPADATVTPAALRRLKAIEEFSDLGAGFQVALADLEIRGAGNLLGTEQSGHIAAVGYDLYCRLLEEAARVLKGEPVASRREPAHVRLLGEAYFPDEYLSLPEEKFGLYRKLARAATETELDTAIRHITDRFGPPPAAARRAFDAARLRVLATAAGFSSIDEKKGGVELRGGPDARVPKEAETAGAGLWRLRRDADWIARAMRALRG